MNPFHSYAHSVLRIPFEFSVQSIPMTAFAMNVSLWKNESVPLLCEIGNRDFAHCFCPLIRNVYFPEECVAPEI